MKKVENAVVLTEEEYADLKKAARQQKRQKPKKRNPVKVLRSITAFLFVTAQVAAIFWVSTSYAIAIYATVKLGQPFPVETVSEQAITVLLGVLVAKVAENIFEHNDGFLLGTSKKAEPADETAEG